MEPQIRTPVARRALVLGLDGATFDLLDPLMAAGLLPFLRSMSDAGSRARLTSVFPPKTIPAWYSFATGKDPGELGVFGFTEPDGGPGRSRIVQTFRPAEAVWDRLSRRGVKVGVIDFPLKAGYPLHGFVIPGMLTENAPTFPDGLRAEVETAIGEAYLPELPPYRESDRAEWLGLATRAVEQHARVAEHLIDRFDPAFLFTLLRETDRVQHQHWRDLAAPVERIPADLVAFFRAVDATCARIDRAFRARGGGSTFVVSDHGHGAARADFFTNRWLAEAGYLVFRPGAGREPMRRQLLSRALLLAERFGPGRAIVHAVADRLRGNARRELVGRLVAGEASFEAAASRIDWDRTVAYSYPVPEGIYLNRYNPHLTPEAGRAIVREIRAHLEAYSGARIEVFEPGQLYRGARLANAPALLVRIDGLATEPRMDFSYPHVLLRDRPGFFYGSGVHRMDGVLLVKGDSPSDRPLPPAVSILDLAPTILEAMGVPPPDGLHGRSLAPTLGLAA